LLSRDGDREPRQPRGPGPDPDPSVSARTILGQGRLQALPRLALSAEDDEVAGRGAEFVESAGVDADHERHRLEVRVGHVVDDGEPADGPGIGRSFDAGDGPRSARGEPECEPLVPSRDHLDVLERNGPAGRQPLARPLGCTDGDAGTGRADLEEGGVGRPVARPDDPDRGIDDATDTVQSLDRRRLGVAGTRLEVQRDTGRAGPSRGVGGGQRDRVCSRLEGPGRPLAGRVRPVVERPGVG